MLCLVVFQQPHTSVIPLLHDRVHVSYLQCHSDQLVSVILWDCVQDLLGSTAASHHPFRSVQWSSGCMLSGRKISSDFFSPFQFLCLTTIISLPCLWCHTEILSPPWISSQLLGNFQQLWCHLDPQLGSSHPCQICRTQHVPLSIIWNQCWWECPLDLHTTHVLIVGNELKYSATCRGS